MMDVDKVFPYDDIYFIGTIEESEEEEESSQGSDEVDRLSEDLPLEVKLKRAYEDHENGWYFLLTSYVNLLTLSF